jgi:hypothetical protein
MIEIIAEIYSPFNNLMLFIINGYLVEKRGLDS